MPIDEIAIKYYPRQLAFARLASLSIAPVSKFVAPLACLVLGSCLIYSLFSGHRFDGTELQAISWLCLSIIATAAGFYLRNIVSSETIRLTAQGIELPWFTLMRAGLARNRRPWSDVASVTTNVVPNKLQGGITIRFHDGGSTVLRRSGFAQEDFERLLVTLAEVTPSASLKGALQMFGLSNKLQAEYQRLPYIRGLSTSCFVPLETGVQLQSGRITVENTLVLGGWSAIYLVRLDGSQQAILKESNFPSGIGDEHKEKALELFDREAVLLARLNHPHIAKVYDNFVENGRHYIVMELIRGTDLRRLVEATGRQNEQTLLAWGLQIAEILDYLHLQEPPIIHRDLTPDNLVLSDSNDIILIDFGAANEFLGTATGTLVGKQSYIAPEQFRKHAIAKSDIYALGATLHFLSTGFDPVALSQSHPKRINHALSNRFDEVVAHCTELSGDARPTAKQLFQLLKETALCASNSNP